MDSSQVIRQKIKESEARLNTSFNGSIYVPKNDFLGYPTEIVNWSGGKPVRTTLGSYPSSAGKKIGIKGISDHAHSEWTKWNGWYQDKTNGGGYNGPNYSKKQLRQAQEFYLTFYYSALVLLRKERKIYKDLLADLEEVSGTLEVIMENQLLITEIAKEESEEKEAVLETKKFKDQIVARNVLIYVLPLIAIGITAFLIWKRKK
jgi:hypothetical protein